MLEAVIHLSGGVAAVGAVSALCLLGRANFYATGEPQSGGPLLSVDTVGEDRWSATGRAASLGAKPEANRLRRRATAWFLASIMAGVVHAATRHLAG